MSGITEATWPFEYPDAEERWGDCNDYLTTQEDTMNQNDMLNANINVFEAFHLADHNTLIAFVETRKGDKNAEMEEGDWSQLPNFVKNHTCLCWQERFCYLHGPWSTPEPVEDEREFYWEDDPTVFHGGDPCGPCTRGDLCNYMVWLQEEKIQAEIAVLRRVEMVRQGLRNEPTANITDNTQELPF